MGRRGVGGMPPLRGRMPFGGEGEPWARYDQLAEALGLTAEELFSELHSGRTVEEIAEEQGVDLEALRQTWADEFMAEREQAMRDAIAQAVEDGEMTQEQADWLLKGIDNDYLKGLGTILGGRGCGGPMGRRGGLPRRAPAVDEADVTETSA
jgi:hypothetical protein